MVSPPIGPEETTPEPGPVGRNTSDRLIVAAARRITGEHKAMRQTPLWRTILVGAGIAIASSGGTWLAKGAWSGVKESINEGKADSQALIDLKTANDTAHIGVNKRLDKLDTRTKDQGKVLRSVARKLKVDVPPERDDP